MRDLRVESERDASNQFTEAARDAHDVVAVAAVEDPRRPDVVVLIRTFGAAGRCAH